MKRKEILTTENTERTEVDAVASGHSVVNTEDLPDGFQMTELGPLPKEWRVVRLGEVAAVDWGNTALTKSLYKPSGYIAFSATGPDGFLDFYEQSGEAVIVSAIGARCGKCFYASGQWTAIKNTIVIRGEQIDNLFLYYYLDDEHKWPKSGSGQPFISIGKAKEVPIPLPPLPEQRSIAHVLRTVQRAKEATEGVIATLKELKKSLMQHLFTYGPVPVTERERVPLQETEIGPLPAHWRVVRLGEVATLFTRGIDPANAGAKRYIGLEHIEPGNIRLQHWGKADDVRSLKTAFQQGDVLYGKLRPYLDKAVLAEWDGICSTDILVIKTQSSLLPEFLAYLVHTSQFIDYAISTTTGVNHPRTSWKALQKFSIPLPPLAEQREIARILQAVDGKIAAEQARRAALEEMFKTLLHQLMTGKIRINDPVGAERRCAPTISAPTTTDTFPFPKPED